VRKIADEYPNLLVTKKVDTRLASPFEVESPAGELIFSGLKLGKFPHSRVVLDEIRAYMDREKDKVEDAKEKEA
jgi:hypothetical protein